MGFLCIDWMEVMELEWRTFHHLFQLFLTGDPILGFLAAHGNRYVFLEPCQWQANQ